MGRVADATVPAPRRSDDAIAFATARSSNNGDGVVPPQPFNLEGHDPKWWWAQGGCAVDPASLLLATTAFGRGARYATPRRRSLSERAQAPCARPAVLLQQPSRSAGPPHLWDTPLGLDAVV